ncbi:MAG: WecB/TagA/CpsF family glycosyltransferase [Ignavibacteriaceae bacterium]|nr:WecB/TagA/CpsF family glycosyltransferase [Ignavibacteriaceae bacterium]
MYSLNLDGIQIQSTDLSELKYYLLDSLDKSGNSKIIVTFNLEFYRNALINKDFYTVCQNADMVIPDGISIIHFLKLKYNKRLKRITGNDLFNLILTISNEIPIKIAFVGSTVKVIEKLKKKIHIDYPACNVVAAISPSFFFENNEEENKKIINQLIISQPDVLFLALGNPRQELWLDKHKDQIGSKINVGVGATFDFYTGHRRRSPLLFQKLALEWAWRLFQEPVRLSKRYLIQGVPFYIRKIFQIILKNDKKS